MPDPIPQPRPYPPQFPMIPAIEEAESLGNNLHIRLRLILDHQLPPHTRAWLNTAECHISNCLNVLETLHQRLEEDIDD